MQPPPFPFRSRTITIRNRGWLAWALLCPAFAASAAAAPAEHVVIDPRRHAHRRRRLRFSAVLLCLGLRLPQVAVRAPGYRAADGLTFFFDRDAKAELVGPTYEGLRRFLKAPHDTDAVVRYIDEAIRKARAPRTRP